MAMAERTKCAQDFNNSTQQGREFGQEISNFQQEMETPSTSGSYPNLLEKYEIQDRIGDGGQGEVYRVRRHVDGAVFACKTVQIRDARELQLVQQEVRTMQRVRGFQGAVQLEEVILDQLDREACFWHLVLELCACSLHDRIQIEQGLSEREAALLVTSLCKSLQHLHSLGIVHRDLKPPNILLTSSSPPYEPKIADFGLSVAFSMSGIQLMKGSVGTPKYLAPEVLRDSFYDKRVDIWGLGLILYEALSGKTAFQGLDSDFVLERLTWVDMPADMLDWSGVSLEAKELVLGMLCLDPDRRLSTEEILNHPWLVRNCECGDGFIPRTPSRVVKLRRLNGRWVSEKEIVERKHEDRKRKHEHDQAQARGNKLRLKCVNGLWQVVKPCPVAV